MAVKRNGLGKGLDSLIPNKTVKTTEKQANKTQNGAAGDCAGHSAAHH